MKIEDTKPKEFYYLELTGRTKSVTLDVASQVEAIKRHAKNVEF